MMVRRSLLVPGIIFAVLVAVLVVGLLFPLEAANCFVDHTKTGGNDDGSDSTNAYLTLGQALAAARTAGDTVWVRATHKDTLAADINVASSGTPLAPIVIWGVFLVSDAPLISTTQFCGTEVTTRLPTS